MYFLMLAHACLIIFSASCLMDDLPTPIVLFHFACIAINLACLLKLYTLD